MSPEKGNWHFKPEWLDIPEIPSNSIHLDGINVMGKDSPEINESTPQFIVDSQRQKYQELLLQHDALEVSCHAIELMCDGNPRHGGWKYFDLSKLIPIARDLYARGLLVANWEQKLAVSDTIKLLSKIESIPIEQRQKAAVDIFKSWFTGSMPTDTKKMEEICDKLFRLQVEIDVYSSLDWEIEPVMSDWLARLVDAASGSGDLQDGTVDNPVPD